MDEILDEIISLIGDYVADLPDEDILSLYDSLISELEERKSLLIENFN